VDCVRGQASADALNGPARVLGLEFPAPFQSRNGCYPTKRPQDFLVLRHVMIKFSQAWIGSPRLSLREARFSSLDLPGFFVSEQLRRG
jgi:hypothetical protein